MGTRRSFLVTMMAAAGVLLNPVKALAKKVAFRLGKAEKLKEVGGSTILQIKGEPILFVRDSKTSVRAIHSVCTHQKCTVGYNPETGRIECACHKSAFGLDGKVLAGPAPKPLTTYPTELKGDRVVVSLD